MSSEIRVNKINNRAGLGTVTYTDTGIIVSGIVTATSIEVDQLEVAANNTTVGVAITQSGSGDILKLYDGTSEVFTVANQDDGVGAVTISSPKPRIVFNETNASPDYQIRMNGGNFSIHDSTNDIGRFSISPTRTDINNPVLINNDILYIGDKLVHWTDDDTAVRFPSANTISMETAGSERLRIDSSGRILVNKTSTSLSHKLQVESGGDANAIAIIGRSADDIGEFSFYENDASTKLGEIQYRQDHVNFRHRVGDIRFATGGVTERVRIDSSGRLLLNTTTTYASNQIMIVKGASPSAGGNRPYDGQLAIESTETSGAINTGGVLAFIGHDGGTARGFGSIRNLKEDGTSGNYGTYMSFETRTNGSAPAEKLRIDSSGHMGLGVTPNANWPTNADFKALQIGTGACLFGRGSGDEDRGGIAVNWYTDGSNNKYIGNGNAARIYLADGNIYFSTAGANSSGANASMTLTDRMILSSSGRLGLGGFQHNYTMNSQSTDLVIGNGGGGRGITFWTAGAADNQTISFQTNETLSRAEGEISYGPTATSTAADRNAMMFRTNSAERFRIDKNGSLTNTTNSSHSQGAGTFNIKGVINQYSQGSGSGLIFDCDFGRLTGYGDDTNVTNGTNLSACLAHSTTDWTSSNSNTPMTVNGGTFQYRVGFGGYFDCITNGGRVSIGAGSGVPAMSDKLNTAAMTIETWVWYDGDGREVIVSRFGSGYPNQFNMLCDPNGQFHYNNTGVGAGGGNVSGEHFPDKTWHHHVWQYESGVNRWYINGAFANSRSAGSSLAVSSGTGFAIASRADRTEDWRGKIAVVRIYNRALSATEIKNHFELERGRFGV